MRKLLTDGTGPGPTPRPGRPSNLTQYIIPGILVLALLIGVAILSYSFGVSRGKGSANSQRDDFYISRQSSWNATATAESSNPANTANGSSTAGASLSLPPSSYARVDKIEGDKVTMLLLNGAGQSTGTLVVTITKQTLIWRGSPDQIVELKPGDGVLVSGQRVEGGGYEARTVIVLP